MRADSALLLVVDMQEPFLREIWERKRVIRNVSLLLEAARILNVPVLSTLQYARRMGGPIPEIAELLPESPPPMDKLCFSCAGDSAIAEAIRTNGRNQVLICGIESHICVCQTALDLVNQEHQVHVAVDAVSSRTESNARIGLRKMETAGVIPSSAEMAIYEMLNEAGTPEFKSIVELVRTK